MTIKKQMKAMNDLYRIQRHFYDATRRFFLPGRDLLLRELTGPADLSGDTNILEVGCGTGRNLIKLGRRWPMAGLYGIDISSEMLRTAERKARQSKLRNIYLAVADAETFKSKHLFPQITSFDAIFFSYSLSMIPDWRKAIDRAMENLSDKGSLFVVDFWDQEGWPRGLRQLFKYWLTLFHVRYEVGMLEYLEETAHRSGLPFQVRSIAGRYAFLAIIKNA